jgi:predicted ester cyclase
MDPGSVLPGLFAAGDAGDLDSFAQYLHEDVVVHAPAGLSTRGLADEQDSWRRAKAAIPDLQHNLLEVLADGDAVAARCVVSGTLSGTLGDLSADGRPFVVDQALFAHMRDGRIEELWEIVDSASLMKQLGGP